MHRRAARTGSSALAAFAALVVLAPAAAVGAALAGGTRYAGETAEGMAVSLRLSGDGRHIRRLAIRYRVTCDNGAAGAASAEFLDVAIRSRGSFSHTGTYRRRSDHSRNRVRLRGRVTTRVARGTFSAKAVGRPQGSKRKVRCRSAVVRWRASPVS